MTEPLVKRVNSFSKKYKELFYIMAFLYAFWDQRVSIKEMIHDEITSRLADGKVIEQKFTFINYRLDQLEKRTSDKKPIPSQACPAVKFEATLPESPENPKPNRT